MHPKTIASPAGSFVELASRIGAEAVPSRLQAMAFLAKAFVFRARRALRDPNGKRPRKFAQTPIDESSVIMAEAKSFLYANHQQGDASLQAGKVENLRKVAGYLNGITIPEGEVFSFWAHVPRPTRARGFVKGRELREGCIIPSTGGGLCQVSNAIYQVATDAGFEIVERHAHSRILPGSMAAHGRDATIFWNYVDLRFKPDVECQLEVKLSSNELIVCFHLTRTNLEAIKKHRCHPERSAVKSKDLTEIKEASFRSIAPHGSPENCDTCHITKCFRHMDRTPSNAGMTAWLVDACWPEHDTYLRQNHKAGDWLFTPLDGRRYDISPYCWSSAAFTQIRQAPLETLTRSIRSRRLSAQGATRQRALLEMDAALARRYARSVPCHATHLVISQNLLPFLWREGILGGRTFDVLMTRLPMAALHATLNDAATRWPEFPSLADFRAPKELIADESDALAAARHWITPHTALAALAGTHAKKLDWISLPAAQETIAHEKHAILFPASTLARKGACEVRHAARELGLKVLLGGPVIESPTFWNGIDTARFDYAAGDRIPRDILAVILPAWVENQPRRLLAAARMGVPVIASENCGLGAVPGITEIPPGDTDALIAALTLPGINSSPAGSQRVFSNPPRTSGLFRPSRPVSLP